jgi:NAD(P)-dependent dehydrogenase (short-subunit alcohol dehydrogenase family)
MPAPVIIVTGVSRGIGRAISDKLQSRRAAVVGAARNVADIPATASLLPMAADVSQETGRKAVLEATLARHGRIDGLVNNVGAASWPCPIPITSPAISWPWTAATWHRACPVDSL